MGNGSRLTLTTKLEPPFGYTETDSEIVRRLEGTEGHQSHFWSPDSRFVAFFAKGKLEKMDLLAARGGST